MTTQQIKQQADELAEKCAASVEMHILMNEKTACIETMAAIILHELNLESLIADKVCLDWCERGNKSKDMGGYWQIRTGDSIGTLRTAILSAIESEEKK